MCVVLNIPLCFALNFTFTTTDIGSGKRSNSDVCSCRCLLIGGQQFSVLSPRATGVETIVSYKITESNSNSENHGN